MPRQDYTSAAIVADTLSPDGVRITTFEVHFPRIILAEVNTHKVIAKSSASSRAIPINKRIADIMSQPYIPEFGLNQPGMKDAGPVSASTQATAERIWGKAAQAALTAADLLSQLGVHKQYANRLLEPFMYHKAVLTATEWDNYFNLRAHADAQPEFRVLAELMKTLYTTNVPYYGEEWHLPYVTAAEIAALSPESRWKVSAARCARTSYRSLKTGLVSTVDEDVALCDSLIASGHMSPFEHVAFADRRISREPDGELVWERPADQRHLYGWIPVRTTLEGDTPHRRLAIR